MPLGLHAERASRKLKGNVSLLSSSSSSFQRREALNSVATLADELRKTANYHEFIDSTFLMNDDKDCSKEVAEWLLKSSDEDDDNLTFERFARTLIRVYWHLPQNFASRHKKSILLGFSRYFNIDTKNNNQKSSSSLLSPQAVSVSNVLCEETRAYFDAFLEKLEDVSADAALEYVPAVSMLLSLYARTERRQRKKDDDTTTKNRVVPVFNAALDDNAHLMIRLCKWILDTVMRDIKNGRNVSNVAACTDVATLTQRLLRDFCQCEGAEKEKRNANNRAIIKEGIVLNTLFDALEFNIFGGTSIGTALAAHLLDKISDDDTGEETTTSEQQIAAAFGFSSTKYGDTAHVGNVSMSLQFCNHVEKQSNLALAHFLRGFVVALAPEVLSSSTSRLARDVFFPVVLTILERCEDPHAIFHAINAITTLLQRLIDAEISRDDSFFALLRRVSQALLSRWDDINTTASTTREIACAFDALCDCAFGTDKKKFDPSGMRWGQETFQSILNLTFNANGGARKSRFKPLSALAKRLGSRVIMGMRTTILSDVLDVMSNDDSLGPSASWLLIELSKSYRVEERSFSISWKRWWTDALFPFFIQPDGKKRRSVATHALPIAFQEEYGGDSSFAAELAREVLSFGDGSKSFSSHLRAGAIVTIMRAARNAQLCDPKLFGRIRSKVVKSLNNKRERKKKRKETLSKGETLHPETNNARSSDDEEADGSFFDVSHSMIETAALSSCEISRTDAMELLCWEGKGSSQTLPGAQELALLKRILPHHLRGESSAQMNSLRSAISRLFDRIHFGLLRKKYIDDEHRITSEDFIKWLLKKSVLNLYPAAPYERKATAIEILSCARNVTSSPQGEGIDNGYARILSEELLQNEAAARVLLNASLDSWDRLRKSAFDMLSALPSPLPGVETGAELRKHLTWAKSMILSPMVKESDAAALQVRLWIKKYVFELKWSFTLVPEVSVSVPEKLTDAQSPPVFSLLDTLNDFIEVQVQLASIDVLAACKKSLAHGPLLLARYALEEIDFNSIQSDCESKEKLRRTFDKLIDLIIRVTLLARDNISTPDMLGVSASEVARGKESSKVSGSAVVAANSAVDFDNEETEEFLSPEAQTIVAASWLTMKEVGLLVGALSSKTKHTDLLSGDALKHLGEHLISVMLEVKHAGAIDKTRIGLTTLCERLLDDYDVAGRNLSALPMRWLTILLNEEIVNKAKLSMKDRVRRSAGIPFAFLALLLSEKSSSMRPMLKYAIEELFKVLQIEREDDEELFSTQIHAFNVLRVIFKDRDLSLATSIYAAQGAELCINRMGATPQWEVRNAATLCFSSLVQKLTGIANADYEITSIKSQSKALHANDFFTKYPSLHAFFDRELELSAIDEGDETCEVEIRASLNAILAILTRLKVNTNYEGLGNGVGDGGPSVSSALDPSSFVPHLEACSTSKYMSIRDRCATAIAIVARPFERSRILTRALDEATYSERYSNRTHGALLRVKSVLRIIMDESCDRSSARKACDEFTEEITRCALRGLLQSSHLLKKMDKNGDPIVPALLASTWLECAIVTLQLSDVLLSCASSPSLSSSRLASMPSALLEIVDVNTSSVDALRGQLDQRYSSEPGLSDLTSLISRRLVEWSIINGNDLSTVSRVLTDDGVPYEGKEAIMETLLACALADEISDVDACTLCSCIWNYLHRMTSSFDGVVRDCEGSYASLKLALQLLARLDQTGATHSEHLNTLCALSQRVRNEECRVEAMRTWGVLLSASENGSDIAENAYEFVTLLDRETMDWQSASTDVRLAAADALHNSGLLKYVFKNGEKEALKSLFVNDEAHTKLVKISFLILEDEDDDVRRSACVGVMSAINGTTTIKDLPQTECVLKLAFRALFDGRTTMEPWLADSFALLFPEVCESTILLTAFSEQKIKSTTRNHQKLFDEEEHPRREPMLLAQMAAHALKRAMMESNDYADTVVNALSAARVTIEGCVHNLERFIDIAKSANMDAACYANENVEAFHFVTVNMIVIWMLKNSSPSAQSFREACVLFSGASLVHPSLRFTALRTVLGNSDEGEDCDDNERQHHHPCFLL